MTYPLTMTCTGQDHRMIPDREVLEQFQDYRIVRIASHEHFRLIVFRLEHKRTQEFWYMIFKNCLSFIHGDLQFDQLLKMEIRCGGTCYVHGALMETRQDTNMADTFLEVLIWDNTDPVIPHYRIAAEEITIKQEILIE